MLSMSEKILDLVEFKNKHMKRIINLLTFCIISITPISGIAQQDEPVIEVRYTTLENGQSKDFKIYQAGAKEPFNGTINEYYSNGQVRTAFRINKGMPDYVNVYYDNGEYDEKAGYLIMSFDGPFWGTKQPFDYYYPNGDQRAMYGPRSIYTPFGNDSYYKDKLGFKFRSREEIEEEEIPPFLFKRLEERAKDGHAETQYFLGYIYLTGIYVPKNADKAEKWYEMGAKQGHALSQLAVAIMNLGKTETEEIKDLEKSIYWFTESAKNGNPMAQYYLGVVLYGFKNDKEQAFRWYSEAAKNGNGGALYELGVMYSNGDFVEKDLKKAFEYFSKGDEVNHPSCQYALGNMYFYGNGVKKKEKQAIKLYKKAARKGHEKAIATLKEMGITDFGSDVKVLPAFLAPFVK